MKTFKNFCENLSKQKEYESTRHEDDYYQPPMQKLANKRRAKLKVMLNREIGRHTV